MFNKENLFICCLLVANNAGYSGISLFLTVLVWLNNFFFSSNCSLLSLPNTYILNLPENAIFSVR